MKSNAHRKLYKPDYFGWRWYTQRVSLAVKRADKQAAKKAARKDRKTFEVR